MTTIPVTRFNGWLKCHRPVDLSDFGKSALEFALPRFLERSEPDAYQRSQMRATGHLYDYVHAPLRNRRRFSGDYLDYTLPRGSYYTLCLGKDGDDKQTLAFEMTAYSDPSETGELRVLDLVDKRFSEQVTPGQKTQHAVGLLFRSRPEKISPFLPLASQHLKRSVDDLRDQDVLVLLPYRVSEVTIERTIDLRLPLTREWFCRTFRAGDGRVLRVVDDTGVDSFFRMLPTLMFPDLGGHDVGQAIGIWMRLNRVEALIYPSARNDTRCVIKGGALDKAFGWNLVNYRGAPPLRKAL